MAVACIGKLWRWASKCGSVSDAEGASVADHEPVADHRELVADDFVDDHELDADVSVPRLDHEEPTIFLSHSGKQKAFVENLYNALQRVNLSPFLDKHTLPPGSPFPLRIKRAAHDCRLGVIVLSDDFLNSKWPMIELEILVSKDQPNTYVLPLFYKLSPQELKSPENLSKWRHTWTEIAPECINEWERAVKNLRSFNGVVFIPGASETAYINKVVHSICKLVPSPILYDLSEIKGEQRLAKVVARQFEEVARQCDTVCMVGLHGVGGLGKTTMCKVMGNFYNSQYPGKSCHIEFPSDGDDKKIVQECKKALKTLTNLSDEHVLNKVDNFDQVVQLMKKNLSRHDVFLAIDNVWESSLEKAERILGVGFSAKSKILLTSRSDQVLKDLVRGHRMTHLGPLPCPNHEEAFEILQATFSHGDLDSLVNRSQLDSVLKKCFFSGSYHALALKAVSQHVNRVCELDGLHCLPLILEDISNRDLRRVEDLIILNYVNLPEHKKHMFLDIVTVVKENELIFEGFEVDLPYGRAHQWLSLLYKEYSRGTITNLIYELALDGLIQLEEDAHSKMVIRVHDLYSHLAQKEANSSCRFFRDGSSRSVEEIEWERLERVMLKRAYSACFAEKLQQQECRKLQVLCGVMVHLESGIDMELMPSLCILRLEVGSLRSIKNWSAATGLAIVHLWGIECVPPLRALPSMPWLEELVIDDVDSVEGPPDLKGCRHLKKLVLAERSVFMKESNWEASYFNSLTNLEILRIGHFKSSTGVVNINALVNLQSLEIGKCEAVERIEGLDALKNLQSLCIAECGSLRKLGGLNPALKRVDVRDCKALKKMPDVSGLTCLEALWLGGNEAMEEVGGENLSCTLEVLDVGGCRSLRRFPSLKGCIHLHSLVASPRFVITVDLNAEKLKLPNLCLSDGEWTSETERVISGRLAHLGRLIIRKCDKLVKLDAISNNVEYLSVEECPALQEIGDLSGLHSLQELRVWHCPNLKKLGGFPTSPHLQSLVLRDCESLGESTIPNVSLIPDVFISGCGTHAPMRRSPNQPNRFIARSRLKRHASISHLHVKRHAIGTSLIPQHGGGVHHPA